MKTGAITPVTNDAIPMLKGVLVVRQKLSELVYSRFGFPSATDGYVQEESWQRKVAVMSSI